MFAVILASPVSIYLNKILLRKLSVVLAFIELYRNLLLILILITVLKDPSPHVSVNPLKLTSHGILHYLWSVDLLEHFSQFRNSRLQMFFKIGGLKKFADFTGKLFCWNL